MAQRPLALGLFLCEQVIVEEGTRNVTLVNCFTHRTVRRFPSEKFPFVVFARLTDGSGSMPLDVTIQRLDTLNEIHAVSRPLRLGSQLEVVRCHVRIQDCSFPVPGDYQVTLSVDNESIAQQKLRVLLKGGSP
jgi:hypothetical protein